MMQSLRNGTLELTSRLLQKSVLRINKEPCYSDIIVLQNNYLIVYLYHVDQAFHSVSGAASPY